MAKNSGIDLARLILEHSHGSNQEPSFLRSEASKIGFPVLLKAVRGGGGKGMRIAMTADVLEDQLESAKSEAMGAFGDNVMLVEKYITTPRHIEVQIFADNHGMSLICPETRTPCFFFLLKIVRVQDMTQGHRSPLVLLGLYYCSNLDFEKDR